MPDCSKGLKSRTSSDSERVKREYCRNCRMTIARIQNARQQMREVKREMRRTVKELDTETRNLQQILAIIDIVSPAFMRYNMRWVDDITSILDSNRENASGNGSYQDEV